MGSIKEYIKRVQTGVAITCSIHISVLFCSVLFCFIYLFNIAMVITAYEDLQQFEGAFTETLCPEFNNVETLLDNNGTPILLFIN